MAFTQGGLLITQQKKDKVSTVSATGVVSLWATLNPTGNLDLERYIAVSPGLGGFTAGEVYVSVQKNIWQIDPVTKAVTLCVNIPALPNSNNFLVFDQVGTFGFNLISSAARTRSSTPSMPPVTPPRLRTLARPRLRSREATSPR